MRRHTAFRIGSYICLVLMLACLVASGFIIRPAQAEEMKNELQQLIDQAKTDTILKVPAGEYSGPILITKPIHVEAEGTVTVRSQGDAPVVTLKSNQASLRGLTLLDERQGAETATLVVEGSRNVVKELTIETKGTGLQLRNGEHNQIIGNKIKGLLAGKAIPTGLNETRSPGKKGNGIDLKEANNNTIIGNLVENMFDGIYVETSHNNRVEKNMVYDSRYGYHLMFSNDVTLRHNQGDRNVTGGMVMGSDNAIVTDNRFTKQNESVNSQGILLFDVQKARVERNYVEGNRVGLYVEAAEKNEISYNQILQNYIGLQLKESKDNLFTGNHFIGNVTQAEAQGSTDNLLQMNYWDSAQSVDLQGDGKSDLSYRINPFFFALTDQVEAFQIFFQSPGLLFLESMFDDHSGAFLHDPQPLMAPIEQQNQAPATHSPMILVISAIMFFGSIYFIYLMGVRTK
ncbi:copper-binding protein [Brevibacillus sp. SKDU10]|uniref:right-handed parallel beta-helix repeat-containing protein n=1 Tax=Brevibacillus sp. SKDU10 TaxID=1247872 RepID=UPI0007C91860|nr:NosD domain-containing protein [Brevibacillus sp. SKDU10]OAJ74376.1 copper-binding protein [Brevibacillus sp. SKDU10]